MFALTASLLLVVGPASGEALGEEEARAVGALRIQARRHQREGQWDRAAQALRDALEIAPSEKRLYEELALVYRHSGGPAEEAPRGLPRPVARTQREGQGHGLVPSSFRALDKRQTRTALVAAGGLLALLIIAMTLRVLLRRSGDLSVEIGLPAGRSGNFTVRLLRTRPAKMLRLPPDFQPPDRASTDLEHNMVSRETLFRGLPAQDWWVILEGRLSDGEVVSREVEVAVSGKKLTRIAFDLAPDACPVEVRLVVGGRTISGKVALAGDPDSVRLAKRGRAKLQLPRGRHQLLAGGEGRGAEASIEVEDFAPQTLLIDLADASNLVFEDCDGAVEPFLRGDLSVAAAALARAGQTEAGALLAARFHREHGSLERAASQLAEMGRHLEAAELWAEHGRFEDAATHFERAGDLERAAEMYNADGDLLRAGKAYMDSGDYDSAIICYREAGDIPHLIDVLEKKGDFFEAGRLSMQRNDVERGLRNFQRVEARHECYFQTCRILAEAFQKQGKDELAIQKADDAMSFRASGELSPKLHDWHADLLDRAGRPDRAVKILEQLQKKSPGELENLATRIEAMRRRAAELSSSAGSLSFRGKAFGDTSRYALHDQIGSGGMGVVYRATDRRLSREVALKRLPENLKDHPRAVELFLHEARASAGLNHPNIVTVHDVDVEGDIYFITMELLRGANLQQLVRARGSLSWADASRLGIQTCAGLAYAHGCGLVHRDIKSANLFFTDDRIVKIMDFGLAKMMAEVRKTTTVTGGTPYYMAPEQASGSEQVDPRTDLYAFGVTLFELVTGRRPFEEGDIREHHRSTPAPDPRVHGVELPDAFAELVMQLMAKSPDERPVSAETVSTRLRQLLDRRS